MSDTESRKRAREDEAPDDDSTSEDDFGPALPSSVPPKKKRKLPYEALYVAALPRGVKYSKSLMHKDQIAFVDVAAAPVDFVMTASVDGVVKFWKKVATGIEFAKEYRAHEGKVRSTCVSADGAYYATAGDEEETSGLTRTVKIFDVVTFDLLTILNLGAPGSGPAGTAGDVVVCWVHRRGSPPTLAVAEGKTIRIFDIRGDVQTPVHTLSNIHRGDLTAMVYNARYDCVISADAAGFVEYWRPGDNYEKPDEVFKMKSSTDLFDFKKAKSAPCCITVSPTGHRFATLSFPDRKVRVFDFLTGKLHRSYDESLETITAMQQAGREGFRLSDVEFGRRIATERELDNPAVRARINVAFDESGNFIFYGSLLGIKVVNTTTNRVMRVYGKDESFRALNVALYQGAPQQKGVVTVSMAASANPLLHDAEERDPILFATGYGKVRFYMFTNEEQPNKSDRDVHNEKPRAAAGKKKEDERKVQTGVAATLHTTYGDILVRLFPDAAPKTVENFVTHARNGYYNNTIFHRIIKGFMIQGGDPLGDGTGGESIWGKEFEDEISHHKHDKPYTLSMANAGPNTNGSQFFVTTAQASWLDGKHTVFGRAYKGMDVVHQIENTPVVKEKPKEDIKIVNITIG